MFFAGLSIWLTASVPSIISLPKTVATLVSYEIGGFLKTNILIFFFVEMYTAASSSYTMVYR